VEAVRSNLNIGADLRVGPRPREGAYLIMPGPHTQVCPYVVVTLFIQRQFSLSHSGFFSTNVEPQISIRASVLSP
jgi:hypothetical protein